MPVFRRLLAAATLFTLLFSMTAWASSASAPASQQRAKWKQGPIKIALSQSLFQFEPNIKSDSDVRGAVGRAIADWAGLADIEFVETVSDKLNVSPAGQAGDGVSLITIAPTTENILLFKNDNEEAAKTRVFVDRRGYITEADIVLSPLQQFSTDGSYGTFDLESTLKHEIGHLLGLSHSSVVGALMYDSAATNGIFGDRTAGISRITEDDRSAIRDLYDTGQGTDCCGSLAGRITGTIKGGRTELWLQETSSGRIVAHAAAGADGSYRFGGVERGDYRVIVRETGKNGYAAYIIGETTIENGETAALNRKSSRRPLDFSVLMIGRNGVLSDSPLKLSRGETYQVYAGGRNLSADGFSVETGSQLVFADNSSLAAVAYEGGYSGLRFDLTIDENAPAGLYNLCLASKGGVRDCVPGGIIVTAGK